MERFRGQTRAEICLNHFCRGLVKCASGTSLEHFINEALFNWIKKIIEFSDNQSFPSHKIRVHTTGLTC